MPRVGDNYNKQPEFSNKGQETGKPADERYNFSKLATPPEPVNLADVSYTSYTTGGIHAPGVQAVAESHFGYISTPPADSDEEDSEGVLSFTSAASLSSSEVAPSEQPFSCDDELFADAAKVWIDFSVENNLTEGLGPYLEELGADVRNILFKDSDWKHRNVAEKIYDEYQKTVDLKPTEKITIDLTPFQGKIEGISSLVRGTLTEEEITGIVSYIESHREEITKEVGENGALYIRRGQAGNDYPPRSVMATMEGDELKIYVAIKKVEGAGLWKDEKLTQEGVQLGKGSFKRVRFALDYEEVKLVAAATIRPEQEWELRGAIEEYQRLKEVGKAHGFTVSGCRYSAKRGAIQDRILLIMPLANCGTTEKISYDDSIWNDLSKEQRKELLLGGATWLKDFHQAGLCFADGKEANILWHEEEDGHITVMMTDLGGVVDLNNIDAKHRLCNGSRPYLSNDMADAVVKKQAVDFTKTGKAGDIFTYGMLLWSFTHKNTGLHEYTTGQLPPWMTHFVKVDQWGHALDNNIYATNHESGIVDVTNRLEYLCWLMTHPDPSLRPAMDVVENVLAHQLDREDEDLEVGGDLAAFPSYQFTDKLD